MAALDRVYHPILVHCVARPGRTFGFFLLLLAGSLGLSKAFLKFHMFPVSVDEFFVSIEMPMGTSLERSGETMAELEKILMRLPAHEVESIISEIGVTGDERQKRHGTHYAQSRIILDRSGKRDRDGTVILREIRSELKATSDRLGVVKMEITQRKAGPPQGKAIEARLIADDFAHLAGLLHLTGPPASHGPVRDPQVF